MAIDHSLDQRPTRRVRRKLSVRFSLLEPHHLLGRHRFPLHWHVGIAVFLMRLNDAQLTELIKRLSYKSDPSWLGLKHGLIRRLDHHWKRVHACYHGLCVSRSLTELQLQYAFNREGHVIVVLRCRFHGRLVASRPVVSPQFSTSRDKALLSLIAGILRCQPTPSKTLRAEDERRRWFVNHCIAYFGQNQPERFPGPSRFRYRKWRFELQLLLDAVSTTPALVRLIPDHFRRWLYETRQCGAGHALKLGFIPEGQDDLAWVLYEAIYPYLRPARSSDARQISHHPTAAETAA